PGPQAGRRRRHRTDDRRHGRLLAGAGGDGRDAPLDRARHPRAHRRRAGARGHRVPRRALRGADADDERPQGARVQLPLRRPRDPAADDAAEERPAGGDARGGRGAARPGHARMGPPAGAVRRGRERRLPRQAQDRPADHRHRRGRRHARREGLSGRHPRRRRPHLNRRRARAERLRARRHDRGRPAKGVRGDQTRPFRRHALPQGHRAPRAAGL
ncbi:MAG: Phosphoribosylamine--glycine ligase, partial [uncultured Phycisphaerae bacterium]